MVAAVGGQGDDREWRDWGDRRGRVLTVLPDVGPAAEDERSLAGVRSRAALLPGRGEADRVGGVFVAPDAVHDRGEAEGDGHGLVEGDVARYLIDDVNALVPVL